MFIVEDIPRMVDWENYLYLGAIDQSYSVAVVQCVQSGVQAMAAELLLPGYEKVPRLVSTANVYIVWIPPIRSETTIAAWTQVQQNLQSFQRFREGKHLRHD